MSLFQHKPRHIIFLIHGIGGNRTHFGHTVKALSRVLRKKDPSRHYAVVNIEYDTGDDEKTPYEFAQDIAADINAVAGASGFDPEDRISLIMHSQGGLIGSIWMFQSLMGTPGYSPPETLQHLDSFITLATPFWGAKTAKWGGEMRDLASRFKVDVPRIFGRQQLEQMSFGSDMIFDFRMAMIDPQYRPYIEYLKNHVKFLNVVGVADLLNPLGIFISGTEKYEDDGAVPLSCARFDFFYSQWIDGAYDDGAKRTMAHVNNIEMAPYVVVNAMHVSPLPEVENLSGIAQVPRRCIKDETARHPAFSYLWKVILGDPVEQLDDRLGDFKTFLLDINVRVMAEREYSCDDLCIEFFRLDGAPLAESNIELGKFFEVYARGKRKSEKYPNHFRFYFTGSIKRLLANRKEALLIKVSGKGLKTKMIEMRLKEGFSSFVDVSLNEKK